MEQEGVMKGRKIQNIRNIQLNGQDVTLFEAWNLEGDTWVFGGEFSAPEGATMRQLLDKVQEVENKRS